MTYFFTSNLHICRFEVKKEQPYMAVNDCRVCQSSKIVQTQDGTLLRRWFKSRHALQLLAENTDCKFLLNKIQIKDSQLYNQCSRHVKIYCDHIDKSQLRNFKITANIGMRHKCSKYKLPILYVLNPINVRVTSRVCRLWAPTTIYLTKNVFYQRNQQNLSFQETVTPNESIPK
jgi:hypothetical protein